MRHGTVDFDELIRPGRYTVVRISPLNMPHHVQPLAMQAFILKLWFTIQERANRVTDEADRTQVVLALDEFQIVKDLQVLQLMLEQARSLGLGLVLSHQTTEQISDRQLGLITGNSGTQLVGKVNGKDASRISQIWDPQFQRELTQQFASQEYFRWTIREKAAPGQEQPPPIQFWLNMPPQLLSTDEQYRKILADQLERYGRGMVEDTIVRQAAADRTKWLGHISVQLPTRMQWRIMLLLRDGPMRQNELVSMLRVSNRSEVADALRGMTDQGLVEKTEPENRLSAYALTGRARDDYFDFDVGPIGTAEDIERIAGSVIRGYLETGLFVTVSAQKITKGRDRTDLIAYSYDNDVPISVEIESSSEVQSHPEHVRYNMTKWARMGFEQCHIWSSNPRLLQIFEGLEEDEKRGVQARLLDP